MSHEHVLWEEGMFLGPQHFQAWERHLLHQLHSRAHGLSPFGYGLTSLEVDADALVQGEFVVLQAGGVFRDGVCFRAPAHDPLPVRRRFADAFHPRANVLGVHLAVREARPGSMLSKPEDASAIGRYRRRKVEMQDELAGATTREVAIGDLDLRVLWEGESLDGYQSLEVARVVRTGSAYQLDKDFVPTCLCVGASPALVKILKRAAELLSSKSEELAGKRGQRAGGTVQFTAADAAGFWLRHTVNTHLPLVAHHCRSPLVHPEAAYATLASLVGALCTFSPDRRPTSVPPYEHSNLTATFTELDRQLRDLPQNIVPETCVGIPLQRKGPDEWVGQVQDESLFERADFYLSLAGNSSPDKFIREAPFKVKITSPDQMGAIRTYNVRGVPLVHVPVPPTEIPQRPGCHYFALTREGKHWEAVRDARTIALSIPTEFDEVQVECLAVKKVGS
ncbi:MAG: type VI secretion system baseplate subunit TssK [Planctomycetes bacterium]|nr:type VI secretion system baseplate subunit TssK [Planctomycetota bacterium]